MAIIPQSVSDFLGQRRFAVAGVSRDPGQAANAVYRKLRDSGFEVFPVNPRASEVEGVRSPRGAPAPIRTGREPGPRTRPRRRCPPTARPRAATPECSGSRARRRYVP